MACSAFAAVAIWISGLSFACIYDASQKRLCTCGIGGFRTLRILEHVQAWWVLGRQRVESSTALCLKAKGFRFRVGRARAVLLNPRP